MEELGDVVGGAPGQELGARFRPHLADGFHRQLGLAFDEQREDGRPLGIEERAENLGEIRGVLLLQQIQQVGRRADAQQPFD